MKVCNDYTLLPYVREKRNMVFAWTAIALILVVVPLMAFHPGTNKAWAQNPAKTPSVLIVDAGLGDFELAELHWLGEEPDIVAENAELLLATKSHPLWWTDANSAENSESSASTSNGDADANAPEAAPSPATFMLGSSSGKAITADDIAWALDAIRESGAEPRTFVVAFGAPGLSLREYAEDLSSRKQSGRADIVGMAFCGTPQNGYSAMGTYPEQPLWELIAQSAGRQVDDLNPQSDYLKTLNEGVFPRVTKNLSAAGAVGDLGFGPTDGAGVADDFSLRDSISDQTESERVSATISRQINLTSLWEPFTSSINYAGRSVDTQLTERLSAFESYEISSEARDAVRGFYQAWFSDGTPVTHNSNVLLLDLSGSMVEPIDAHGNKLDAAKEAAWQYLQAMQNCSKLPQSAPLDVSVYGFNETLTKVAEGYDQSSMNALEGIAAQGETNIGIALDQALETLGNAPTCASKHVLLLSDGESTRGKSDEEMLNGAVAQAAAAGIVIDTIGFGDVGESDAGFLQQVADATGGVYYQANDTYSLKVNFLKSYYSSLGLNLVDEEIASGATSQSLGQVDAQTSALQLGVVGSDAAPEIKLSCNGAELSPDSYTVEQNNGLTSVQCLNPPVGEYTLELIGNTGSTHVFAVKQQGITHPVIVSGEQADFSLFLLIGAGVLFVVALVAAIALSSRKSKAANPASR